MVEILNNNSSYPTVVLTSVEMDCCSITESEFIDTVKKYLVEANKEYKDLVTPKCKEFIAKEYVRDLELSIKKAKAYSESKWKTEKRRNQYIEEVKAKVKKDYEKSLSELENISIDFFDFDGNCDTTGAINSNCIIRNNVTDEQLKNCYRVLKTTKYFNKAIGLKFVYKADSRTYTYLFRPSIKLILPEEIKKVAEKERKNFENCVSNFYSLNNYTGD